MNVIDASAMVEFLVGRQPDPELVEAVRSDTAAPHLLDVEVLSALRGLTRGRKLDQQDAVDARDSYFDLPMDRWTTQPFAERIWSLRHQFTSYDASYLALAEALDAPLYTCDRKLAADGHEATVKLIPRST